MQHIVVVGGGAGGLELVTKLGNRLGKKNKAKITLVDRSQSHLWKPLLHEVATGSLDDGVDAISYRAHAANHHFDFQFGRLEGIDRERKVIQLAPVIDQIDGELVPAREISYDTLVLCIGSVTNDFNTPGARENCIFLDRPKEARHFRFEMRNAFLKLMAQDDPDAKVNIAIVGGGATGVELAAELYNTAGELQHYGFDKLDNSRLNVHIVEAAPRILSALPEKISNQATKELTRIGVKVHVSTKVTEVTKEGLYTEEGDFIPSSISLWSAGVKAPDVLKDIGGLENNRANQLVIKPTLQTTRDDNIFVIGDSAGLMQESGRWVPPRAQSAHQMAGHLYKNIVAQLNGKPLKPYVYSDHGALINMNGLNTIGSVMGGKHPYYVRGHFAHWLYLYLYRMHQHAIHGCFKTGLIILAGRLNKLLRPSLKLH